MPKLKKNHFTGLSNIFGEKGKNLASLLNGKADHELFDAIEPLEEDADLADVVAKVNELLAAAKTPADA